MIDVEVPGQRVCGGVGGTVTEAHRGEHLIVVGGGAQKTPTSVPFEVAGRDVRVRAPPSSTPVPAAAAGRPSRPRGLIWKKSASNAFTSS